MNSTSDVTYPIRNPNDPILKTLRESLQREHRKHDDTTTNYFVLPLIGRIRFLRDKNGIMLLSSIVAYWIYGIWSSWYVIIQPHYQDGRIPSVFVYYHLAVAALCLLALVTAATRNPGTLPSVDAVFAQTNNWETCPTCGKFRPPKAHHCRRCKQCVVRMDHHCPWINNCVGEDNHFVFTQLILYAFLFSFNTFVFLMLHFWYWGKCNTCDKENFLIKYGIWFQYLSTLMSGAMGFFMLMQLMQQHFNIIMDRTTLENMKLANIHDLDPSTVNIREFCYAYRDHCGTWKCYLWFWPCRRRKSTLLSQVSYA